MICCPMTTQIKTILEVLVAGTPPSVILADQLKTCSPRFERGKRLFSAISSADARQTGLQPLARIQANAMYQDQPTTRRIVSLRRDSRIRSQLRERDILAASHLLLVPQNIDRQNARSGARGNQRGDDADGERGGGDPHAVEGVGLKRNVGHGIDLRVERDQVIGAGGPGDRVTGDRVRRRCRSLLPSVLAA